MSKFIRFLPLLFCVFFVENNLFASSVYDFASIAKLDRLFTDKVSRSKIIKGRIVKNKGKGLAVDDHKSLLTKDDFIKLNGFVIRENNFPVVWINNKVYSQRTSLPPSVSISADSSDNKQTIIRLKQAKSLVSLKSGQFWFHADKSTYEGYELPKLKRTNKAVLDNNSVVGNTISDRLLPSLIK